MTPYCLQTKSPDYFELLRFSRVTGLETTSRDMSSTLAVLNSLPTTNLPVRPLIPLLYRNALQTKIFEDICEESQVFLKQSSMILVGKELANQQWLKTTIESFDKHDISIILLKGAAFANVLYPPDAPRPGGDVDFLVRTADFDKTCEVLSATMNPTVMAENRLFTHRTLFERSFVSSKRSVPDADVHRGLTNPHIFTIDEEALWSASQPHKEHNKERVRVLSPEHTLLHLAVHAFREMDFCTHNLLDAHELISRKGIIEKVLLENASDWGAKTILYYLLFNVRAAMNTKIEPDLLTKLQPNLVRRRIHSSFLRSKTLHSGEKSIRHRAAQFGSQLIFPDKITAAIRFQTEYARTRIKDLTTN